MLDVAYNGKILKVEKGTIVSKLLEKEINEAEVPIIACKFNNEVKIIDYDLKKNGKLELINVASKDGQRIYVRGLIAIVIKAFEKLFKKSSLRVNYTLGDSIYCDIDGEELDKDDFTKLTNQVIEMIKQDIPFERLKIPIEEALELNIDNITKERLELSKNRFDSYVTLYKFQDSYYYLYGVMPKSTGKINIFDIMPYEKGVLIRYPNVSNPNELEEFKPSKKLYNTLAEYEDIHQSMGIISVSALNKVIKNDEGDELIRVDEALHEKKISQIADKIAADKNVKVILIAGPSSSRKNYIFEKISNTIKNKWFKTSYNFSG